MYLQFHSATCRIRVLQSFSVILFVHEDGPCDQPEDRVAPKRGVTQQLLEFGDRRLLEKTKAHLVLAGRYTWEEILIGALK